MLTYRVLRGVSLAFFAYRPCESASEAIGPETTTVLLFLGAPSLRNQPLCLTLRHYHRTVSSTWELQI